MKRTVSVGKGTKQDILDRLSFVPPLALTVTVRVFTSRAKSGKKENWYVENAGRLIPVLCTYVSALDEDEKRGTAIVSVDLPVVGALVDQNSPAHEWLKKKKSEIDTFGSFQLNHNFSELRLILNSDRGLDFYLLVMSKHPDLKFYIKDE